MPSSKSRIWAFVAAAALASLTLGVFAPLQNYGPESAVRRFNVALLRHDPLDLQRVTEQDLRTADANELARRVLSLLRAGASFQLVRMERQSSQVRAVVVYTVPSNPSVSPGKVQFPMVYVVEKTGRVWRINASKTLTILRDRLGW